MSLKFDTGRRAKHAVMLGAGSGAAAVADSSGGQQSWRHMLHSAAAAARFHVCVMCTVHTHRTPCVCANAYGGLREMSGVILGCSFTFFIEAGLSTDRAHSIG